MRGWLEIAIVAAGLGSTALAAPSDWIGSERCRGCHAAAAASWAAGPHAGATAALGSDRRRQQCLGCHATGEAPAGRALFDGVGCESCHGPGAGYSPGDIMRDPVLSAALGLAALDTPAAREPVCRRCHQQELRPAPFDVEAAWRRLPHAGFAAVERSKLNVESVQPAGLTGPKL